MFSLNMFSLRERERAQATWFRHHVIVLDYAAMDDIIY